jgi:hypothetical protein
MKPWIWLRVAAALQAFFTFGHTVGGIPRKAIHGLQEQALFDAMRALQFDVMGSTRSNWDFYRGFSITVSIAFAVLTVLLWQLATMSRAQPANARPLVATILVGELLIAFVSLNDFFIIPSVTAVLVSLCLAVTLAASYRSDAVASQVVATG